MASAAGVGVAAVGFVLYATVVGAIATYAVGGGSWSRPVSNANLPPPQIQLRTPPAAAIVAGITVVDGDCTEYCAATRTVYCTTTTDRITTDWMLMSRTRSK